MKALLMVLLAAVPAVSQQTHVVLDPEATKISFTLGDVLHVVHGTFKLTKGEFWFEAATGHAGGELVVSAGSGKSGNHTRDNRMGQSVLESDHYSEITFMPDRVDGQVNLSGDSKFQLHGTFQIHGAGHELTMNVVAHLGDGRLAATATFEVPYVKWGMKDPSALFLRVNDAVQIEIAAAGQIH